MSMSYLQIRNGHYHLRVRTPSDLLQVIPRREIVKTLKTKDLRTAKVTALPYLQGISKTFALLRSGYIHPEQATESLSKLLCIKSTPKPEDSAKTPQKPDMQAVKLSSVVKSFIDEKEREWSRKTKMEAQGVYRLVIDLLGDIPVHIIDRPMARQLVPPQSKMDFQAA